MNDFFDWWGNINWTEIFTNTFTVCVIVFLPITAWALISVSVTLSRMERNFIAVQEIRADVDHLNKITSCLEPARELEPEQCPELPEIK